MIARVSAWTAEELASAVGGELRGEAQCRLLGVSTDTREALRDHLFVALVGERFDGHDFLASAVEAGAKALLVQRGRGSRPAGAAAVIEVDDTLFALGELGRAHRRRNSATVVGLTGSNGKTTTKEMLASILSVSRPTLSTEGNLNNRIGVPLTLLGLESDHRAAVVEMGMNQLGEIARLTQIAEPDLGIITNIGPAHIGELGSLEAIAQAKGELFRGLVELPRATQAIVNLSDARVREQAEQAGLSELRTFGWEGEGDVSVLSAESVEDGQLVTFRVDGREIEVHLPLPGSHNASNAAAAVAAATSPRWAEPVSLDDVQAGLADLELPGGRFRVESIGGLWVIDDSYNANAASMLASLQAARSVARHRGGRLVAALGEMRELGEFSAAEHARVGEAAGISVELLAVFGSRAAPLAWAAKKSGIESRFEPEDFELLWSWLAERLRAGDVVLVKGSRGAHMERVVARIRERGEF